MADVIAGRYVLLSSLGRGGMGEVFLADDLVLGRRVAIKRILAGSALDRVAIERLIREARLAATLHHPHVVAVHDLVTDGDRTHIVMEYVDARSLAEMIRAKKTLAPDVVGRIGGQIASALEAAHRAGIIHRDVKPSNILVDEHQVAKLADFGVARSAGDPNLTGTGMMIGSVAFMAPEIARGEDVTPAADIYSLGATMYAAIEGHAPFASEAEPSSSMRMLARLITESAPYASHGGSFAGLIRRMMSSDPTDRPTAGEVQRSLAVLTAGPTPGTPATREKPDEDATRVPVATKAEVPQPPAPSQIAPDTNGTATVLRGSALPPIAATPAGDIPDAGRRRLVDAARGGTPPEEGDVSATLLGISPPTPTPTPPTPDGDAPDAALMRLADATRVTPAREVDSLTQLRNPSTALTPGADSLPLPAGAPPANPKRKRLLLVAIGAVVLVVLAGALVAVRWAGALNGVTALATGELHTCALDQDGRVRCWGSNVAGQLGDGTTKQHAEPVVIDISGVTTLTAGASHTCALTQEGLVNCWGDNESGQLGDGSTTKRTKPVTVTGLDGVTALAAGASHTCAITQDEKVHCWGDNNYGQLGDGTTDQRTKPVTVKSLDGVTALAAGASHTCAITQNKEVHCWGANYSGQLGDGTTDQRTKPVTVKSLDGVTALAAGASHTCALDQNRTAHCWGANYLGQLGERPDGNDRTKPVTVASLTDVTSLAAGYSHTCAPTQDGQVHCWGDNSSGQVGEGTTGDEPSKPVTAPGLTNVTAVSTGGAHTCALTQDGQVHCWGDNRAGQLGDGTTAQSTTPLDTSLTSMSALTAGDYHTCALTDDGRVHCWGDNRAGQLGDGTTDQRYSPVDIGLTDVTALAAGSGHTCALTQDGHVHCWGDNRAGQLGDGTTDQRTKPVTVKSLDGVTALATGDYHSCALTADGRAHCWGGNTSGQLGDGTTDQRTKPVTVTDLTGITALTAGGHHTCALNQDQKARCWGNNDVGQLGDGTTDQRTKPVAVTHLGDVTGLAAGYWHTCALTLDGKAHCWGNNNSGQLGDGTTADGTSPMANVTDLTDVTALSAGGWHTCALTLDGSAHCWGNNDSGQLGDGTTDKRAKPVTVTDITGVTSLSAGGLHTCAITQGGLVTCWGNNGWGQLGDDKTNRLSPVTVVS